MDPRETKLDWSIFNDIQQHEYTGNDGSAMLSPTTLALLDQLVATDGDRFAAQPSSCFDLLQPSSCSLPLGTGFCQSELNNCTQTEASSWTPPSHIAPTTVVAPPNPTSNNRWRHHQHVPKDEGSVPGSFQLLTDEQIRSIDFDELLRLMDEAQLTAAQQHEVKLLRRRLKNRKSAHVSSTRRRTRFGDVESQNELLVQRARLLEQQNAALQLANSQLQARCAELSKTAIRTAQEKLFMQHEIQRLNQLASQLARAANLTETDIALAA